MKLRCLPLTSFSGGEEVAREVSEIVVVPAGVVELAGHETSLIMNKKAADAVIADFNDHGTEIPIDFEHSSIYQAENGIPAPAAGWIPLGGLYWDPDRGLVARVEWNDGIQEMIQAKEYKYLSPVVLVDERSRMPVMLHSVALTNKPKIKNMDELLAASDRIAAILSKEITVPAKPKKKPRLIAKLDDGRVTLQRVVAEETLPGIDVEAADDDSQTELDEAALDVDAFKEVLSTWGVSFEGEPTTTQILQAAGQLLMKLYEEVNAAEDATPVDEVVESVEVPDSPTGGGGGGEETSEEVNAEDEEEEEEEGATDEEEDEEDEDVKARKKAASQKLGDLEDMKALATIANRLGLPPESTIEQVEAKIVATQGHVGHVPVEDYNKLAARLKVIEDKDASENLEALVASAVSAHKLNPFNEKQMEWARDFAQRDPKGFRGVMEGAPTILPTGSLVASTNSPSESSSETGGRKQLIAASRREYHDTPQLTAMTSVEAYVNTSLKAEGQPELTDNEKGDLS